MRRTKTKIKKGVWGLEQDQDLIRKLGIVEAGFASPVDEDFADMLRIEDYLIRDKNASFLLRMEGDALIQEGICDGDLIIFERGAGADLGDLVILLDTDGYTVAFLTQGERRQVMGLVVSVVRKYT